MTSEEIYACEKLKNSCELMTPEDAVAYLDAIDRLKANRSVEILRIMVNCLRDTDAGEVQYELVEACEAYPMEVYVSTFIDEAIEVKKKAPEWFKLMFQSILNARPYQEIALVVIMNSNLEIKKLFFNALEEIVAKSPKYIPTLLELKAGGR